MDDVQTETDPEAIAAETLAIRQQIRDAGHKAAEYLAGRLGTDQAASLKTPATLLDVAMTQINLHAQIQDYVINYVERNAVLKNEVEHEALTRSLPTWRGVWRHGSAHSKDSLVVHKNALWISTEASTAEPGTPESAWRLAVKSPR